MSAKDYNAHEINTNFWVITILKPLPVSIKFEGRDITTAYRLKTENKPTHVVIVFKVNSVKMTVYKKKKFTRYPNSH